jgi:hypothetical protein
MELVVGGGPEAAAARNEWLDRWMEGWMDASPNGKVVLILRKTLNNQSTYCTVSTVVQ